MISVCICDEEIEGAIQRTAENDSESDTCDDFNEFEQVSRDTAWPAIAFYGHAAVDYTFGMENAVMCLTHPGEQ
jgi:hypothetical protein